METKTKRAFDRADQAAQEAISAYRETWLRLKREISDHVTSKADETSVIGAGLYNLILTTHSDEEIRIFVELWKFTKGGP